MVTWDSMIHHQQEAEVESATEKEGNELGEEEAKISVYKNTDTETSNKNELDNGKKSEKLCILEPNINI